MSIVEAEVAAGPGRSERTVHTAPRAGVITRDIADRIAVARFVLIIGIVLLHVPPHQTLEQLSLAPFEFLKGLVSDALFRAALPVLTAISGYLLFSHPIPYPALVRKKFLSLVVPMLAWTVPVALAIYLAQRYGLVAYGFSAQLFPAHPDAWLNAVLGLTQQPVNYPLHFLRDLFVLALLSPLIGAVVRRTPTLAVLAAIVITLFDLDGPLLLRDDLLIYFTVGAIAAVRRWDLRAFDRHAVACLLIVVGASVVTVISDYDMGIAFRLVGIFLVWPALSLLLGTRVGEFLRKHSRSSFIVFLSHGPLLGLAWLVYRARFAFIPYPVFWVAAPILSVTVAIAADHFLRRRMPRVRELVLGGR